MLNNPSEKEPTPLIDDEDISMESALTTCIDHFMGHEDDRIAEAACKLAKAVEPITEVIGKYW